MLSLFAYNYPNLHCISIGDPVIKKKNFTCVTNWGPLLRVRTHLFFYSCARSEPVEEYPRALEEILRQAQDERTIKQLILNIKHSFCSTIT
jgi:hypothetical protein